MGERKIELPNRDRLEELYWKHELSTEQIAAKYGVAGCTIRQLMYKFGIPRRTVREAGKARVRVGRKYCRARGKDNPAWKGGRRIDSRGYVNLYMPEHPRARSSDYVFEHIVVWEKRHGPVPKGWHIHHRNGIKHDNRIENLEAMTPKKHHELIPEMRKRIVDLEQQVATLQAKVILLGGTV